MRKRDPSFRGFIWQYARVVATLFVLVVLLYGAVSYPHSKRQTQEMLEGNLAQASYYLNTMFNSMAYTGYTLAADSDVSAVMNSPLTVEPYRMVKTQQLCDRQRVQGEIYGCASLYLYHTQTGLTFATGMGKLQDTDFHDGAFLQELAHRPAPALVERTLSGMPILTVVTRYSSGASNRNAGYLCFNISRQHMNAQLSGLLRSNCILSLGIADGEAAVYLSQNGNRPVDGDFTAASRLDAYDIQLRAFYPRRLFLQEFAWNYLRISAVFFLLILGYSAVLFWGFRSLQQVFKPVIFKLADLYRQSDSWQDWTIGGLKESFDRLLHDRQSYSRQLDDMQGMVREKIFTDLLMGNITGEEEFTQLCRNTGICFEHEAFLVACVQTFGVGKELTAEEKVLSRVLVKNIFAQHSRRDENQLLRAVEENEENIGIIVSWSPREDDRMLEYFLDLAAQARKSLAANSSIDLFVTIRLPVEDMMQIPEAYSRAKTDQIYRYIATNTYYMASDMSGPETRPLVPPMDMNRIISATNADRLDLVHRYVQAMVDSFDETSAEEWYKLKSRALVIAGSIFNQAFLSTQQTMWQQLYEETEQMLRADNGKQLLEGLRRLTDILNRERITSLSQSESGSQYVRKAYLFIEENYERDFSISDIAEYLSINVKYLSRLFKQESGQTMTQYISKLRLEKAVKLLEQSELTVQAVGTQVGFGDVRGFIRLFKKAYGETPNEY
ncbi:AraC family transcriptional regulator, partial [Ruminococcaceae bacterium OttesenSCG-928-L11]|nr:AraC family transcriptional regulator [Ruminococcaceae bacterium OttesenSCG-928-L11]